MTHDTLFVFDLETIPDTEALKALTGVESDDVAEIRAAASQYHLDATNGNNDFTRQPFHQIVALSYVHTKIERDGAHERYFFQGVKTGGDAADSEAEILTKATQFLSQKRPRLVHFNGRNFDVPVLYFRCMKHGIPMPWYFKSGDKWNSYTSRYSDDWNCDLLDVMKGYGAMMGGLKLNEIATLLGLPGKLGVDGSMVAPMWDEGKLVEIRNYCEHDVLTTYLVYLHWQHMSGTLRPEDFKTALEDVAEYLLAESAERPHLGEFMDAWEEASGGDILNQL